MELHLALKKVVALNGASILKERRLVNILADFNAYNDVPSAKFIIKTMIDEGYMDKILAIGKLNLNCEKTIDQFTIATGISKDYVVYICKCIGFALQWNNTIFPENIQINCSITDSVLPIPMEERLMSVVDVVNSEEGNCKLKLSNPTASMSDKGKVVVSCEVYGAFEWGAFDVLCSVYSKHAVVQTAKLAHIWNHEFTGFTIASAEFKVKCEVEDITRIIVYIGNN